LDRIRDDLENYRGALTWLIEQGRSAEASDIAWALKYFWLIREHAAEGLRWYEQILTLPSLPPAAESRALVGAAVMWYRQAELDRARTGLNRAIALAQAVDDMDMVARRRIWPDTSNMPQATSARPGSASRIASRVSRRSDSRRALGMR
jgi:hypothetical protein